ncbi:cell wall-binding repeat-containing protein [Euzebya tangerina]|uniref:cell wall-binding repeat-containing protein n=1 Tax=Euzebya tangerina TaxID=591198 RepID=UPI0013C36ED0|nr:cell wall-binding repeat-containing protein [Euzebya tangerina]
MVPITRSMFLVIVLAMAVSVAVAAPASAQATAARIDGGNRYDTAAAIAEQDYPNGTSTVILARADDYADALSSAPVSRRFGAPVLVTDTGNLNAETRAAIVDLDPENVVIFGGPAAVNETVVAQLRASFDVSLSRIAGPNRFATAAAAGGFMAANGGIGQFPAGNSVAFVTQANDFAGTLAAGAPAAAQAFPILLAETNRLPAETSQALADLSIDRVYLIGNEAQIDPSVQNSIAALGIEVIRIGGATRLGTVTAVANAAIAAPWLAGTNVVLARGDLFVDTLAAAPHAAAISAPIILSDSPTALGSAASEWLGAGTTPDIGVIQAIGGPAALSEPTLAAAVAAADGGNDPDPKNSPNQVFVVQPLQELVNDVGENARFTVTGRYDNLPLPATLNVGLYPCATTRVVGTENDTFADIEPDGLADGLGRTDTQFAAIATLNGADITDTRIVRPATVVGGQVTMQVVSVSGPDCTVVVVWQDRNGDGQLGVNSAGQPTELYGVGKVTFG